MKAKDIFIGPLVRRAETNLVTICVATITPINLRFSVKEYGKEEWIGHSDNPTTICVSQNLYFYFGRVRPITGKFPTNRLLAYSIGVVDDHGNADYSDFGEIVRSDSLAYGQSPLPTFYLQDPRKTLIVMYGSCRKIHDVKGGKFDALSKGDTLIEDAFNDLNKRPAILCLGGDQIYADDVDKAVMSQILALAAAIEVARPEKLPIPAPLPGIGRRKDLIKKRANFTSSESDNHLVTLAEYLAIYGLMWNRNNWVDPPPELKHFTDDLRNTRRLLANIASYMIFDDHDVTDDWNLSCKWRENVYKSALGKRIVANGLVAFWLCQGHGNDPDAYTNESTRQIAEQIQNRHQDYGTVEDVFWKMDKWEFTTPTSPFILFLDTRTQRGPRDGPSGNDLGAPAYLKSLASWVLTIGKLRDALKNQDKSLPIVIVAPGPVFGFSFIDTLQSFASTIAGTPYWLDLESWSANAQHLQLFLHLMVNANVVIISGDVHYAYTSTVKYIVFDDHTVRKLFKQIPAESSLPKPPLTGSPTYNPLWTAQFLQLTSSALKNFASTFFTQAPANLTTNEPATIISEDGAAHLGIFKGGKFYIYKPDPRNSDVTLFQEIERGSLRPSSLFRQRINDAFNSRYLSEHNLGVASFRDTIVTNYFLTSRGRETERTWNFTNGKFWE